MWTLISAVVLKLKDIWKLRHFNQPPVLQPLYRSTCISRHLQLKTGWFCWCEAQQRWTLRALINWAVISPPSWQYLRARTIDRCSSSQWSSSFVFITVPSCGSISDRWYLCSYIMRAENKKNSSFDKDCLCFSSLCWCYATAGPVCDLPEKSKGLMEFCRMRSKGPIAGVRFLGGS